MMNGTSQRWLAGLAVWLTALCATPLQAADKPLPSDEQAAANIDAYINAAVRVNRFSGTVLVARSGKPLISRGYGMANYELDVPNTSKTVFRLGSITKPFTAIAILMLQERGKLSVNDPLCKYLPNCPTAWQAITIRHLLTHTSGIPDFFNSAAYSSLRTQPVPPARMIELFSSNPLEFVPGEKAAYSNSGYYLLGVIIERTSGVSYEDFLQQNIFTPLGLAHTGYDRSDRLVKNRASGYLMRNGSLINAPYVDRSNSFSAGALVSTVEDLLQWEQSLYTEKLLSRKSLDAMFAPSLEVFPGVRYGYGWGVTTQFGRQALAHKGDTPGFSNMIIRFPAEATTVIVLGNNGSVDAQPLANDLAAIVFGMPYELPRELVAITLSAETLEKYAGRYEVSPSPQFSPNSVITITLEDGKLMRQVNDGTKAELFAQAETEFFLKVSDARVSFVRDAHGQVTGLIWHRSGVDTPAARVR
jgi:CubicO group peptidase (beta-lactamase class C family)